MATYRRLRSSRSSVKNSHCYILYRLKTPVIGTKNGHNALRDFLEAIQNEMKIRVAADQAFNHTLTKNPLRERW
ncbi:replication initiation protein [Caballeronia sp. SEWSISQ10-4 2]|uniref:replication initiation protein n=1 Tax=Caballeronia sp. SEWSISQ10-4 2 TaxID=2937438 RepID=UPI0026519E99|nr:replication initiation protein [Caballeronia sp. SEWSISQ10-4 2]MDN7179204.1 replication initiation protein [Caballeronia sp. SEWSISQ10-4 2]